MRRIPVLAWLLAVGSTALRLLPFPFAGPLPPARAAFAWICLLPLLLCLHLKGKDGKPLNWRQFAFLGWLSGSLWWATHCYWVYLTFHLYGGATPLEGVLIQVALAGMLGINLAAFALALWTIHRLLNRRAPILSFWLTPLAAAALWVAVELFRARILGVPWDQLGVSQVDNPILMHLPPFTGVYGVSFLIVLVNAMLAQAASAGHALRRALIAVAALVLAAAVTPWPQYHLATPSAEATASAVLLQENLPVGAPAAITLDQMMEDFTQQSEAPATTLLNGIPGLPQTTETTATLAPPAIVIWPESPAPFISTDANFRHWLSALATDDHTALIIGNNGVEPAPDLKRGYRIFNSASFITPDGLFAGRYDKIHLVPFGEYVPFRQQLFFVRSLTAQIGDTDRGTTRRPFTTGGHSYGTFICYEDAFADEVRQFTLAGADVLVTISDDGWYGDSGAAWQHLNLARIRAIENHRWLLRSTNTGITAAINPFGRVNETAPRNIRTAVEVHFGYELGTTFYTRHGDLFAFSCVVLSGLLLLFALALQLRRSETSS